MIASWSIPFILNRGLANTTHYANLQLEIKPASFLLTKGSEPGASKIFPLSRNAKNTYIPQLFKDKTVFGFPDPLFLNGVHQNVC